METSLHRLAASVLISARHETSGVAHTNVTATDQLHQLVLAITEGKTFGKVPVPGAMTIVVLNGAVTIQEDQSQYVAPTGALRVVAGKFLSITASDDAALLVSSAGQIEPLSTDQSVVAEDLADCTQ